ncbi:hypothetical protein [Kineosporia sp. NBRC 101731]|uniref:hypothetical protein n=1 Tax=Kineosporia sp. NBRC 101731 TaxID=3032199 RepID=UPI0024A02E10|nr:hypothetical protein [Kineosporia sp. NBRC 101731]GLY29126.1 hypothetical protein Kisp02_24910 [Kineosporia sp. NBRC 101731]
MSNVVNVGESVDRAGKILPRPSSAPSLTWGRQHRLNALGARLAPRRIVVAIAARTATGPQNV